MILTKLLTQNEDWAKRIDAESNGQFFPTSAEKQSPKVCLSISVSESSQHAVVISMLHTFAAKIIHVKIT